MYIHGVQMVGLSISVGSYNLMQAFKDRHRPCTCTPLVPTNKQMNIYIYHYVKEGINFCNRKLILSSVFFFWGMDVIIHRSIAYNVETGEYTSKYCNIGKQISM